GDEDRESHRRAELVGEHRRLGDEARADGAGGHEEDRAEEGSLPLAGDPRRGRGRCGRGVRGRFLVHGLSLVSAPTASWATPKTLGIVQQSRNSPIWLDSARKHVSRGRGAGMGPEWLESLARERAALGRSSVAERVAATLRDRIIEGELPPGTR